MAGAIFVLAFVWLGAAFLMWRTIRMWRDPEYYKKVLAQTESYPVSREVARGLARGTAGLAVAIVSMAAVLPVAVYTYGDKTLLRTQPALGYTAGALLVLFLIAVAAHLCIAWFNQPKFLVPPYLRHEPGAWRERRTGRKSGT